MTDYKHFSEVENVQVVSFIDRMDLIYAAADFVISRAGASSVSELCPTCQSLPDEPIELHFDLRHVFSFAASTSFGRSLQCFCFGNLHPMDARYHAFI
jgi:hypothetical protein